MAKLPEILEAERLQLRRCRPEHLDPVLLAIEVSVSELALWLPWADPMPTRASLEAFVHDRQADFDADQEWAYFMFETDTDELVGTIALHRRSDDVAEIGYWVRSDRTRRGYATAAAGALTFVAFDRLPEVQRVIIRMDQANVASAAVAARLGFDLVGEEADREIVTSGHTGKGWIWSRRRSNAP